MTVKGGIRYSIKRDRDPGFEDERNDCFVCALQQAAGVPYRDAHEYVGARFKRERGAGTNSPHWVLSNIAEDKHLIFGYRAFRHVVQPTYAPASVYGFRRRGRTIYPTLASLISKMSVGRFIVCSTTHAWAVIDGVVIDCADITSGRTRVFTIYELKPSSRCEAEGL